MISHIAKTPEHEHSDTLEAEERAIAQASIRGVSPHMAGSLLIPKILTVTLVPFGMSISVISFPSLPMTGDESGKTMSLRALFVKCARL